MSAILFHLKIMDLTQISQSIRLRIIITAFTKYPSWDIYQFEKNALYWSFDN